MKITNEDNMELMSRYKDNHFDLAIVDPPYGIGMDGGKIGRGMCYKKKNWDNNTPDQDYFDELKRVSKNYIIWGGNYFAKYFDNMDNFIVWDKIQRDGGTFAMCEMAITSINKPAPIFKKTYHSGNNQFVKRPPRIHPTQKPVKLYEWILDKYAKEGDKILDTHLGSGSIAIACHNRKFDLTACELDKEYFDKAIQRIETHKRQLIMF